MSKNLEFEIKEIDPEGTYTLSLLDKGDDDKEDEGKGRCCQICRSKGHTTYCCSWVLGIPSDIDFVPKVGPSWMVVCMKCGNNENFLDKVKGCPACGWHARYVAQKKCVACRGRGHLDNNDRDCMYYGMKGENDPFRLSLKRIIKGLGLDPKNYLKSP